MRKKEPGKANIRNRTDPLNGVPSMHVKGSS